jgi:hypothetical protein
MTTRNDRPLSDDDKQTQPMPGEVAPADARRMAQHYAAVGRLKLDAARRAAAGRKPGDKKG